jgi:hypothetical protein
MGSDISRLYDPATRAAIHEAFEATWAVLQAHEPCPPSEERNAESASPSVVFLLLSPPKASSIRLSFDRGPCRNCHSSFHR